MKRNNMAANKRRQLFNVKICFIYAILPVLILAYTHYCIAAEHSHPQIFFNGEMVNSKYTGMIDIAGEQIDAGMYYFDDHRSMETDPVPDATMEDILAFDPNSAPFPLILEKDWKVFRYQRGYGKRDFLSAAKKGNPIACAILAVYAHHPDDQAFWMIQADRLTHPGWSHGVVYTILNEFNEDLGAAISNNGDLILDSNSRHSAMIYKGVLLGDGLSLSYAELSRKSLMAGSRALMAMQARVQSGTLPIPWGLAGGLRGSILSWQYVSNRFRVGTPPSQPVDMVKSCGAAFAGVKIGAEQPKGNWDEAGLSACKHFSVDFCSSKQLSPEELQKAQQQGQAWYDEYRAAYDKALEEQRAHRARVWPKVLAEIEVWEAAQTDQTK